MTHLKRLIAIFLVMPFVPIVALCAVVGEICEVLGKIADAWSDYVESKLR